MFYRIIVLWWIKRRGDWGGMQGARGGERGKGDKGEIGKRKKDKMWNRERRGGWGT